MDEKALINVLSGLFDEKLQPVHNRLDRLELKRVSDKVNETYELALENWGQVQESKARLTALES